ncbi:MAG: TVP38/TMEM64 family protein [Phycisphaerae bacterium]|nr:VTT domain-containing protein [Tepidisphaeraceae bacterium]
MSVVPEPEPQPPARRGAGVLRLGLVVVLVSLIGTAIYLLLGTEWGARLRHDHHAAGVEFAKWVADHPVSAPAIFVGLYVLAASSLLPVWWLQILAGYGFGMYAGVGWSLAGAMLGALASFAMSRGLLAHWVREKFEARHARLREIDEKMGHNGLMVVMAARLTHVIPFGVSNYLFGLTRINWIEVAIGTVLGNVPAIALYVATGAGLRPWENWRFLTVLAVLNVVLLVPIALRYWKPGAFKRIGVE